MTEDQLTKTLEANLARLLQWIAAAEARTSVVLGIDTAMLGTLALFAPTPKAWSTAGAAFASLAVGALGLSLAFLAAASFPRTQGPARSLLFFNGIAELGSDEYILKTRSLTSGQYLEDLSRQCHRNAQIAAIKFKWIKLSQMALFFGIIPWTVALFLLYQGRS
jgi:hypothetical protein